MGQGAKHVDGELTMTGAVLEALWGNVMAKLLPYGAVPNKAILLTDNPIATLSPASAGDVHNRKALLVREPVVRPAHFAARPTIILMMRCKGSLRILSGPKNSLSPHRPFCLVL